LQVDLSATLFEEKGSHKTKKKDKEEIRFRWMDLFKHTVDLYSLGEAKRDGIIKLPKLEKVKVYEGEETRGIINFEKLCAWEKYENLLRTGVKRWQENQKVLEQEGDKRKQILFIICNDKKEAEQIYNYLVYREIDDEGKDLSKDGLPVKGFYDEETKQTLFVKDGKTTVTQIHIGQKELNNEKDWEKIGVALNINVMEPKDIAESVIKTREYEMLIFGNILNNAPDLFSFWHSSQRYYPGLNLSLYESDTADAFLESIRRNFDQQDRTEDLVALQSLIIQSTPAIFLFSPNYLYASAPRLEGFSTSFIITPSHRFDTVEKWYVKSTRVFKS